MVGSRTAKKNNNYILTNLTNRNTRGYKSLSPFLNNTTWQLKVKIMLPHFYRVHNIYLRTDLSQIWNIASPYLTGVKFLCAVRSEVVYAHARPLTDRH